MRSRALLHHRSPLRDELKLLERSQREPDDDGQDHDGDAVSADGRNQWPGLHMGVQKEQKCREILLKNVVPDVVDGLEDVERGATQVDVNFSDELEWQWVQGTGS